MVGDQSSILLQEVGASLGLELSFDESAQCLIALDDELYISIQSREDAWVFYGILGNLEADIQPFDDESLERETGLDDQIARGTRAERLLALNLSLAETGGASIALEQNTGVVMQVQHVGLPGITALAVRDALEKFANQLSAAIQTLNEEVPAENFREVELAGPASIPILRG